jgi:hypothetical protein
MDGAMIAAVEEKRLAVSAETLENIASASVVLALAGAVTIGEVFSSWSLVAYVVFMTVALITGAPLRRPSALVAVGAGVVMASTFIGAIVSTHSTFAMSMVQASWLAVIMPVLLLRGRILSRALTWAVALYAVNAVVIYAYAYGLPSDSLSRAPGLLGNPNPSSGFLVLGVVTVLSSKKTWVRWLAVPLVVAMPWAGSRWATSVLLVLIAAVARNVPPRTLAAMAVVTALLVLPTLGDALGRYRITGLEETVEGVRVDAENRLAFTTPMEWVPQGVFFTEGDHNVYSRIGAEDGITALGAVLLLAAYGLWRGRGRDRWLLVALLLFGLMDFYTWVPGKLSFALWLVLAANINSEREGQNDPI